MLRAHEGKRLNCADFPPRGRGGENLAPLGGGEDDGELELWRGVKKRLPAVHRLRSTGFDVYSQWVVVEVELADPTINRTGIQIQYATSGGKGNARMSIIHAGTGPVGQLFFEEPEVARYIALVGTAGGFQLPDPASGQNDRHIEGIQAPGLLSGSAPVVFFRTRHTKRPRFSVRLNATRLTQYTFVAADPAERSWHEIIPAGALKPQDNELTFSVSGQGTVVFGDVVILYTSNELTVRKPLVFTQG